MKIQYVQGNPFFTAINKNKRQYPYLEKDIETEVCIIGGGVTGAIASYYFTKNNIDTVVLEKKRIAHLSTSVTTALLQYELDDNVSELLEYSSHDNIIRSYKLGIKALKEIDEFVKEYGNRCDYIKRDTLFYTAKKDEIKSIKIEYGYREKAGIDVSFINKNTNTFSFKLEAGILSKDGGCEIDPYKFTHQLLESSDSCVYENTEAIKLIYHEDFIDVITEFGHKVRAKKVIVATGYNTKLFTDRSFGTKTTSFNIVSKPVASFNGWPGRVLIRDNSDPYNYLRTTKDDRIIIGGEDIRFIPDIFNEKAAEDKYLILESKLKAMFKNIESIEVDYKYCGAFASTSDNLGFVGPDNTHKNLWYLLGYGANGILFAVLGAMMLVKLYNGKYDKDMNLFKVDRFDN